MEPHVSVIGRQDSAWTGAPESSAALMRGREVIGLEAEALAQLAGSLDEGFSEAVRLILETSLRVVVTGMGKSGHIGRKIAATFSATGTPAIFIHPAEAAHGDLGMIVPGDLLIVLSNSGNTSELRSIMAYARGQGCKIIGVAARRNSEVMRASDVRILLPEVREACPLNIAPTSSTTVMLALGDALAVTVMGVRGISRARLELLHPGGNIGLRAVPVDEVMHTGEEMPLVHVSAPMREVIVEMTAKSLGIAGVVDDEGALLGVITDGDLRRNIDRILSVDASEVMSRNPKTISTGTAIGDALAKLTHLKICALFVVDHDRSGRPIGLLHIHDLTRLGIA